MPTGRIVEDHRRSAPQEEVADSTGSELKQDNHILLSVIIPIYNESEKIIPAAKITLKILDDIGLPSELILAEDGSEDGSYEVAAELAAEHPRVRILHSEERLGRGRALNRAIKASKGDVVCYIDADLATDMSHLPPLVGAVFDEGYDFVTGSRMMASSSAKRAKTRYIASSTYNSMVKSLLRSEISDHQCGFKAFKRASLIPLLDQVKDGHWFWDTELLVRGQREGFRCKEIPVKWNEAKDTKVRLFRDSYRMGSSIFKLWWDLQRNGRSH
jgi:hypothetical protein